MYTTIVALVNPRRHPPSIFSECPFVTLPITIQFDSRSLVSDKIAIPVALSQSWLTVKCTFSPSCLLTTRASKGIGILSIGELPSIHMDATTSVEGGVKQSVGKEDFV